MGEFDRMFVHLNKIYRRGRQRNPIHAVMFLVIALPVWLISWWHLLKAFYAINCARLSCTLTYAEWIKTEDSPLMILFTVPMLFPSFILGLLATNYVMYCLSGLRKTLNDESKALSLPDFASSQKTLFKLFLVLFPVCGAVAFAALFMM